MQLRRSANGGMALIPLFLLFTLLLILLTEGIGFFRTVLPVKSGGEEGAFRGTGGGESGESHAPRIQCVIVDAGHGGEDGGAVSATGVYEKDLNLAVAGILRDLFEAAGIPTVMTRTEDKLLYDPSSDYRGHRKMQDLLTRQRIAGHTAGGLFLSIHMNAFPDPRFSGIQVWYGPHSPQSVHIASAIQARAMILQPGNHRRIKAGDSRIFLLNRLTIPSVLVECGFLSHPAEAERLQNPAYQKEIALMIFSAVAPFVCP